MKKIKLNNEKFAIVDASDYKRVSKFNWWHERLAHREYAYHKKSDYGPTERLHQLIAGTPPKGFIIDHREGTGLDNRKKNLRFVTRSLNALNTKRTKGWTRRKEKNRRPTYCVKRQFEGITYYEGDFETKAAAITAAERLLTRLVRMAERTGHERAL